MNSQLYHNQETMQFENVINEFKTVLSLSRQKKQSPRSSAGTPGSARSSISAGSNSRWCQSPGWDLDFDSDYDLNEANGFDKCEEEGHQYYEPVEGQVH